MKASRAHKVDVADMDPHSLVCLLRLFLCAKQDAQRLQDAGHIPARRCSTDGLDIIVLKNLHMADVGVAAC